MRAGLLKDEWMDGWMDTLMSPRFPTADTEFFPLFCLLKKVAEKFLHGYISKVLSVQFSKITESCEEVFCDLLVIVKVLFIDYHEVPIPLSRSEAATLK